MVKKVVISSVKCPTGALDILSISLLHSNMVNSLLSLRLDTFLDGVSTIDVLEVFDYLQLLTWFWSRIMSPQCPNILPSA